MSLNDAEIKQNPNSIEGLENLSTSWLIEYDDLEFGGELARGNFGAVLKASYLGTEVAVKQLFDLDEDMKIYLQRELNVLKQIRHPNIVQFLGLARKADEMFLVTEFVPRGDLSKLLYDRKEKELESWKLRLKIMVQAAQALAFVHAKSLIHRDIKAANYLVGDHWQVKLCDFGFSRSMQNQQQSSGSVMTLCGTDEWMAPETMMGLPYDQKADVFSFGMFLVEMVFRAEPAPRDAGKMFKFNAAGFNKYMPEGCPAGLAKLVTEHCTLFEPEKRPAMKLALKVLQRLESDYEDDSLSNSSSRRKRDDKHKKEKKEKKHREKDRKSAK